MSKVFDHKTVDVSSDDEDDERMTLETKFDRLVSRHRKFTRQFDKNMEMCCGRLSNLMHRNINNLTIKVLNSVFNINLSASNLKNMESKYEDCSLCPNVKHAPVANRSDLNKITIDLNDSRNMDVLSTPLNYIKSQVFILSPNILSPNNLLGANAGNDDGSSSSTESDDDNTTTNNNIKNKNDSADDYFVFFVNKNNNPLNKLEVIITAYKWLRNKSNTIVPSLKTYFVSLGITIFQWIIFIISITLYNTPETPTKGVDDRIFGVFSGSLLRDKLSLHRIVSSAFFHNSLGHLIISTMMHFRFSSVFESVHGVVLTLLMYFICSAYGMIGVSWCIPDVLQANGMAGDWGIAGALLSRLFVFPYLFSREYQHITNLFVSYMCLFFLKTIGKGSEIVVSTHLLSAICGFCIGTLINTRLRGDNSCSLNNIVIDFLCSFILLAVPISSIFLLFIANNTYIK